MQAEPDGHHTSPTASHPRGFERVTVPFSDARTILKCVPCVQLSGPGGVSPASADHLRAGAAKPELKCQLCPLQGDPLRHLWLGLVVQRDGQFGVT